jgi:hypothetical protein
MVDRDGVHVLAVEALVRGGVSGGIELTVPIIPAETLFVGTRIILQRLAAGGRQQNVTRTIFTGAQRGGILIKEQIGLRHSLGLEQRPMQIDHHR